jgi:hypothetical protein
MQQIISIRDLLQELIDQETSCYLEDAWAGEAFLGAVPWNKHQRPVLWTAQQLLTDILTRSDAEWLVETNGQLISLHVDPDNDGETALYWIRPGRLHAQKAE